MKCMKHILILLLVLFIAVAMEAQENYNPKRTLKEVKAQLKAEKYQQAEDILNKAMNEHKEAKSKPEFHYLRLQALRGLATAENRNMFLNTRPDTAKYFTYINRIYEYGFSCDSLDRLPNEKGKVRPSYTSSIVNMLASYRNNIKSGGKSEDYSSPGKGTHYGVYTADHVTDIIADRKPIIKHIVSIN